MNSAVINVSIYALEYTNAIQRHKYPNIIECK